MKAIVFIGSSTSGSSAEAFSAAAQLGYAAILLTDRKTFLRVKEKFPEIADIVFMESMDEESVRKEIDRLAAFLHIQAIISFVDPYVSLAAKLSNAFCNSTLSVEALGMMEDKISTRNALRNHPATCEFEVIDQNHNKPVINYPLILKSPISNGSKDVYFIENEKEFDIALCKMNKRLPQPSWIAEEFIEGPQYMIEIVVVETIPIIVAIIQQEIIMDYTFIVTAYEVVMQMDGTIYRDLRKSILSIVEEIGLRHGTCHLEMRYSSKGWKLIEMNPRIAGGAMNRMITEAFGINLVKETIKLYLGEEPNLLRKKSRCVYTSFITINNYGYLVDIEGIDAASSIPGIIDIAVKPKIGSIVMPPISMGQRYGYTMAVGETSEVAKERAESSARLIKFYLEPI